VCSGICTASRAGAPRAADRLSLVETAVILEGARTPIGRFLGSFAELPAVDLGVLAAREAMRRSGVEPDQIDQTILVTPARRATARTRAAR